ncbi:MAG: phage holin family protein [Pseudomonadota bacterium]
MKSGDDSVKGGHILHLVRETADGLGQLVVQHVKLAQRELTADLQAMGARVALIAVCALVMIGGYTLALAGLACLIGGARAIAVPLLGIGLAHVAGTGVAMGVLFARIRRARLMTATAGEIAQSATALLDATKKAAALEADAPAPARPASLERARAR